MTQLKQLKHHKLHENITQKSSFHLLQSDQHRPTLRPRVTTAMTLRNSSCNGKNTRPPKAAASSSQDIKIGYGMVLVYIGLQLLTYPEMRKALIIDGSD